MAVYDPPQPLWKRNLAGILDFLLSAFVFGYVLFKLFGTPVHAPVVKPDGTTVTEVFSLPPGPSLLLLVLIIAYFVVLGRTGGTVFQRLFRMKRAKRG